MSVIYYLINCCNNKSPVGNFGGVDCKAECFSLQTGALRTPSFARFCSTIGAEIIAQVNPHRDRF